MRFAPGEGGAQELREALNGVGCSMVFGLIPTEGDEYGPGLVPAVVSLTQCDCADVHCEVQEVT
jgi:hypothetical protein